MHRGYATWVPSLSGHIRLASEARFGPSAEPLCDGRVRGSDPRMTRRGPAPQSRSRTAPWHPRRRRRRRAAGPGRWPGPWRAAGGSPGRRPSGRGSGRRRRLGHHPDEVELAVGPAAKGLVGHRRRLGGAGSWRWPIIRRRAGGRTARRRPCDETGLPGSPNTGVPADHAEGQRLGRLDGHLPPVHLARMPVEHDLDVVEVAHAHPARGDDGVAAGQPVPRGPRTGWRPRRRGPVPRSTGTQPASPTRASSVGRLESRIWPGRSGAGPVDQLVAGGQHADPGRREHRHLLEPEAGQHAQMAGREHGARPRTPSHRPAGRRPAARMWSPARRRPPRSATAARRRPPADGALHHHHRVGPGGDRRAGHDAHGLARARRRPRAPAPAASVPTTSSRTGAPAVSAARTAKPSMAVLAKGGTSSPATTASGGHAAQGLGQRQRTRAAAAGRRRGCRPRASSTGRAPSPDASDELLALRPGRPGRRGTRARGRRGRWPARRWPAGSRACRRCRSGPPRTRSRRPSAP